jgi:hypothetical protein
MKRAFLVISALLMIFAFLNEERRNGRDTQEEISRPGAGSYANR